MKTRSSPIVTCLRIVLGSSSNSCLNRNKSGQKRYKCLPPTACKAQGNIVGHCCGKKKCCELYITILLILTNVKFIYKINRCFCVNFK